MFTQQATSPIKVLAYLEQCQYQVIPTSTCADVAALFDHHSVPARPVDAVLFYYNKNNADHVALLTLMQKTHANIPIILITAVTTAKDVTDLLRQQVTAVFRDSLEDGHETCKHGHGENEESDLQALHQCIQRHVRYARTFSDNASMRQMLEQDQQAGHLVQEKLLPPVSTTIDGLVIERFMQSSLYLSGDTVDYFPLANGCMMFYLADVAGHGSSSALLAVLVKTLTQNTLQQYPNIGLHKNELGALVSKLNKNIAELKISQHVTMFMGIISANKNTLHYVVCGHYPMPIIQQHGSTQFLSGCGDGLPLGLVDDAEFILHSIDLADEFNLLVCSDGVLEVLDTAFDTDQESLFLSKIQQHGCHIDGVQQGFNIQAGQNVADDIAVLSIRYTGTGAGYDHS